MQRAIDISIRLELNVHWTRWCVSSFSGNIQFTTYKCDLDQAFSYRHQCGPLRGL